MINFSLNKIYKSHKEVKITLTAEFAEGKIYAIYGNSGAGKSTLLRMLAGLVKPDSGYIKVGSETWFDSSNKKNLRVNKRNIGFLFQDYSLFPNMTVIQNIKFGMDNKEDQQLINRIIDIADLQDLLTRKPDKLSGGQQQRVALARAIARKPKLLLLDEPLSALDGTIRQKLQEEILAINSVIKTTILFVSHDLPEVFKLADEVFVVENGVFTKQGKPHEIFMTQSSDYLGEVLSMKEEDGKKSLQLLVDGKVIGVKIPSN